ncbi:MAG: hypothetical protein GXP58_05720 [Deltaproteobacteria bacterium]|nr:hypothetical protein [Deltaproteobacteria bacterium]
MKRCLSRLFPFFALIIYAAGCAAPVVPPELRGRVNRSVSFSQLVQNPEYYRGTLVVLGGVILSAVNRPQGTEITILQKPLDRGDEPREVDESYGRFIALYKGYLETKVYSKDRRVTVLGVVSGKEERALGEIRYGYPVITVTKIRLWPVQEESSYPPYGWYDPYFYGPYYYRYPYYFPYYPYWP